MPLYTFDSKMLLKDGMGPDALTVVRPTRVCLLDSLLRYSVLFTVESLSLLHLLFIS